MTSLAFAGFLLSISACAWAETYSATDQNLAVIPSDIPLDVTEVLLQYNDLTHICECCFSNYSELVVVNLANNSIRSVSPRAFIGLQTLLELTLSGNQLLTIPELVDAMQTIKVLRLDNNFINGSNAGMLSNYSALLTLNLNNNSIKYFPGPFTPPLSLKKLQLSRANLEFIPRYILESYPQLTTLDLDKNMIDDDALSNLTSYGSPIINEITLEKNNIHTIPTTLAAMFPMMHTLGLSDNPIDGFPSICLPSLTSLELSGASIGNLPRHWLDCTPNLTAVSISYSFVTNISMLASMPHPLESLFLFFNDLPLIPESTFTNLTKLSSLSILNSGIKTIDRAFSPDNINLTYLSLGSNRLQTLSGTGFHNLVNLRYLYLSRNEFSEIPPEITYSKNIRWLWISYNNITHLSSNAFANVTELILLDLDNNNLFSLAPCLNLPSPGTLQYLFLDRNNIEEIPSEYLLGMSNVIQLEIGYNLLSEPPDISPATGLQYLRLQHNRINLLPPGYWENHFYLTLVEIQGNNLTAFESFPSYTPIDTLFLHENRLTECPNLTSIADSLRYLNLNSNPIAYLPKIFKTFSKLEKLNLANTLLTVLPDLSEMVSLFVVNLTNCPLRCGAGMCWMKTPQANELILYLDEYPCRTPATMVNTTWTDVPSGQICPACPDAPMWTGVASIPTNSRFPQSDISLQCQAGYIPNSLPKSSNVIHCGIDSHWYPYTPLQFDCMTNDNVTEPPEVQDDPSEAFLASLVGSIGLIFVATELGLFMFLDLQTYRKDLTKARRRIRRFFRMLNCHYQSKNHIHTEMDMEREWTMCIDGLFTEQNASENEATIAVTMNEDPVMYLEEVENEPCLDEETTLWQSTVVSHPDVDALSNRKEGPKSAMLSESSLTADEDSVGQFIPTSPKTDTSSIGVSGSANPQLSPNHVLALSLDPPTDDTAISALKPPFAKPLQAKQKGNMKWDARKNSLLPGTSGRAGNGDKRYLRARVFQLRDVYALFAPKNQQPQQQADGSRH